MTPDQDQLQSLRKRVARLEVAVEKLTSALVTAGISVPDDVRPQVPMHVTLGRLANERGAWAEREVLAAIHRVMATGNLPDWQAIVDARMATDDENRNGIDVVVVTKAGQVPLQVKSSVAGAQNARMLRKGQALPIILVVSTAQAIDTITRNVRGAIIAGTCELRRRYKAASLAGADSTQ